MKKQLKNLAQKLTLATAIALTPLQTQAHPPYRNHQHRPPIRTQHHQHHQFQTQLHNIAHLLHIYEIENKKYHLPPNTKNIKPTINFYVYNNWQDINLNGWQDNPAEFKGRHRESFHEDEQIQIGTLSFWLNGSTVDYKLLCPHGEEIDSRKVIINHDHAYAPLADFKNGLPKTFQKHGPGVYSAEFFVDNKHIGTRNFILEPNPHKIRNLENHIHSPEQTISQMSQKEKNYYEKEKAMHREESKIYHQQNQENQTNFLGLTIPSQTIYSLKQKQIIKTFHATIRYRANKINKHNTGRLADPIGYNLSEKEILQLHKAYGNFSENSIQKFYKDKR